MVNFERINYMKPIKIITDTCSDITLETAEKYGIKLVPIHIIFGDEDYLDRYDLDTKEFYEKLDNTTVHPKTAQITVQEHIDLFNTYADDYEIIYIPLSANASGTFQSANLAKNTVAEEKPDSRIHIFENNTFTYGYGYWVIEAAKMALAGKSSDEILNMLRDKIYSTEIILNPKTLDYLQKGGRISPTTKIIANVLDISPILAIEDGLVVNREKVRGSKKVLSKMVNMVINNASDDYDQTICVMHGNDIKRAEDFIAAMKEKSEYKNFLIVDVGPCVGIHAGPGVLGISYLKK